MVPAILTIWLRPSAVAAMLATPAKRPTAAPMDRTRKASLLAREAYLREYRCEDLIATVRFGLRNDINLT